MIIDCWLLVCLFVYCGGWGEGVHSMNDCANETIVIEVAIFGDVWSTLLMETGLLHEYFGNFSMQGKKYYFDMQKSIQGSVNPCEVRLK